MTISLLIHYNNMFTGSYMNIIYYTACFLQNPTALFTNTYQYNMNRLGQANVAYCVLGA